MNSDKETLQEMDSHNHPNTTANTPTPPQTHHHHPHKKCRSPQPISLKRFPRFVSISLSTCVLSFLNYSGLAIVGYTTIVLGVVSLLPFMLLSLFSLPKIDPSKWLSFGQEGVEKDWTLYFNTIFWNLNFWESASTLAGEVEEPHKTFPKALISAGLLTCLGYIIPLLAAIGAMPLDQQSWVGGYFAHVAGVIAGNYWG